MTRRLFINPGEDPVEYDALVAAHGALNDVLVAIESGKLSRDQVLAEVSAAVSPPSPPPLPELTQSLKPLEGEEHD